MHLIKKYGYCIVPKGTKLFRKGTWKEDIGVYFTFHPRAAFTDCPIKKDVIQKWEVTCDLKLLFMVSHISGQGHAISAVGEIYREWIDKGSCLGDLSIKARNLDARCALLKLLNQQKIEGWFTSMENSLPLEIFLTSLENKIELKSEFIYDEKIMRPRNSLSRLKFHPSEKFWRISDKHIITNKQYLNNFYRKNKVRYPSIYYELYLRKAQVY